MVTTRTFLPSMANMCASMEITADFPEPVSMPLSTHLTSINVIYITDLIYIETYYRASAPEWHRVAPIEKKWHRLKKSGTEWHRVAPD